MPDHSAGTPASARAGRRTTPTSDADEAIRPFTIDVPQADLDDLAHRLARTRFVPDLPGDDGPGGDVGVPAGRVKRLVGQWRDRYDWRAHEARLNAFPQFTTRIDGLDVHFLHVRSTAPDARPLVLTHGWPMSVAEYLDVVEPLTSAFHLVIPSVPGFGFSGRPTERGWDRRRTARAWAELMRRLGYDRYGAHGNDIGASISLELGRVDAGHVVGVHVTQVFSLPSGDPDELAALSDDDRARIERSQRFIREKGAYLQLLSTQPQTVAHALGDSPAGQLAWSLQLFDDTVENDHVLTNVTIHWLTNTSGTSALTAYHEPAHAARPGPTAPTEPAPVPVGVATFADDVFQSVRPLAERDHPGIVAWHDHPGGGHHPAHQAPATLADDIRGFFLSLPGTAADV